MKQLLLLNSLILLGIVCLFTSTAFAKTATANYSYEDFDTHTVCFFISELPNVSTQDLPPVACDHDSDGFVDIENVQPGRTYYFGARGFDKVTGAATGWSNEVAKDIPGETIPTVVKLPAIEVPELDGFTLDTITFKVD